jgi:hypothetical protein
MENRGFCMIITCIPIASNQIVPQCVLDAYYSQSMSSLLCIVPNENKYIGMNDVPGRLRNCVIARNLCLDKFKEYLKEDEADAFLILDSDCVFQDTIGVELLYRYLKERSDFAAVALNKDNENSIKLEQDHIASGAIMFPRSFFSLGIEYRYKGGDPCECYNLGIDIRSKGKRFGYVDSKKRLEDLHASNLKGQDYGTHCAGKTVNCRGEYQGCRTCHL